MVRVESCFHGYHAYKNAWNTEIGESLEIEVDKLNQHDKRGMPWELLKMDRLLETLNVKY